MFMIFMKYLQPSERLGVFLAAVQSMRAPSPHSTELAAHMVDVLAAETDFHSGQVLHIVWAIYRSLPSVRAALALQSLDRALLLLASKRPRETVASLLQCSLTCTSVAVTMWRAMVSEPPATERVLRELLRILMNQSGCKTSTSTKDHPRILALAAARPLHEILLLPTSRGEAKAIFPQLFLALLFQVSFTTELKLQEVQVFWEKHRQDLLTPVRSTVQALKALLRSVGLGSQVLAIEAQGGWAALLSAESHLWGVQVVAREMKELPRSLRATIIHQLVELLRTEASSWQTVAMVILSKLLECTELGDELDCVVSLFASYLRSPCLGMQSLVLRAILGLTERPATVSGGSRQHHECRGLGWEGVLFTQVRQTLVLLPSITEQLQAADSDTRAVALPVLSTMLRLLEGRTLSLAALELAGKLPALFGDDSSTVRLLSIRLFLDTLGFVEGSQEKLQQVAHRSLLPLSFHLHDQDESVAEASREALLGVARFLRWRQLAHLAETLQSWKIGECLVRTVLHPGPGPGPGPPCAEPAPFPLQLARRSSAAEEYLAQSLPYLQSLQEPLRREAVRFTGLVGRHLLDQHQSKSQDICQVLRGLANDPCESVSSLAIQTVQILQAPRPRSRFSFRQLCSRLQKAWRRRRSSPAGS
ncbi:maestro heat-like repeat-containing protein family member 6 [Anas acuta]|uniref:maestro heat-like repeat-containing protein family member 6 n=1 Tax=Anas acuta TaxID=28680 RepID=UPI0035C8B69B